MYRRRHRNLPKAQGRGPGPEHGPQGRINKMRELVTSLIRHERIEGITDYIDESRGYAERVWQMQLRYSYSLMISLVKLGLRSPH